MKKFLLVIFLISVLTSGLFAVESNIDTSGLEEISWEEVGDNAVIYEVGDGYCIVVIGDDVYIVFK